MCSAASSGGSTRPATRHSRDHLRRIIVDDMADRQQRGCNALQEDGSGCKQSTSEPRCRAHHQEYKSLNTKYKALDQAYQEITGATEDPTPSEQNRKLQLATDLVACRTRVNHRFDWESPTGNRGHIRRILKTQSELESLKVAIDRRSPPQGLAQASASDTISANVETPAPTASQVRCSIVDPNTPIELFNHLPDDHPGRFMRRSLIQLREGAIAALYKVVPALDDSDCNSSSAQPAEETRLMGTACEVLRFVLRGYIVWKADPDVLEDAGCHKFRDVPAKQIV